MDMDSQQLTRANGELRRRLRMLIEQAWHNERTLKRFQSLELQLMVSESFAGLVQLLVYDSRDNLNWDVVTLMLHDPDFEMRRLLQQADIDLDHDFPDLKFVDNPQILREPFGDSHLPVLGRYKNSRDQGLFQHSSLNIKSVAILPLMQGDQMIGSLSLGNESVGRFKDTTATDFLQHLSAVISTCFEMTSVRDQLKYLGLTDALTGINNRRFFDQRLVEEVARGHRSRQPLGCLFVDVDHFKKFNDTYGHACGDHVLRCVAHIIREQLRTQDVVARYGGEEFAVLMSHTGETRAIEVAERIRDRIQQHQTMFEGQGFQVTVSIGVSILGASQNTMEEQSTSEARLIGESLVAEADAALYLAKQAGRNRVECKKD